MLTDSSPVLALQTLALSSEEQRELFDAAVAAFAERLGVSIPESTLSHVDHLAATVLEVHMAALAAVLEYQSVDPDADAWQGLNSSQRILNHERRYWRRAADDAGLGTYDAVDLDRGLAISALLGASSEREAIDSLSLVSD